MKFHCGETLEARYERYQVIITNAAKWQRYFAWWPTNVGSENGKEVCIWLGWIERRRNCRNNNSVRYGSFPSYYDYYREIGSNSQGVTPNDSW